MLVKTEPAQTPLPCEWVIWILAREFVGAGNEARCKTCGAVSPEECRGKQS